MLTQEDIDKVFYYKEGRLYNKYDRGANAKADSVAGTVDKHHNRRKIYLNGKIYQAHRLIYLLHHGYLPRYVDHINGNSRDNRIENLRECTVNQNMHNKRINKNNTSGVKGVSWCKQTKKWEANVCKNKKIRHLGRFSTIKEAKKVVEKARIELHGEFACHG